MKSHLTDPVDKRLARLIARSLRIEGRPGFLVFFKEFMQRGHEAQRELDRQRDREYLEYFE